MANLSSDVVPPLLELHARLCALYPEYDICHQPPLAGPAAGAEGDDGGESVAVCDSFVANAATFGDVFKWHVDGDPSTIPDGLWRERFGLGLGPTAVLGCPCCKCASTRQVVGEACCHPAQDEAVWAVQQPGPGKAAAGQRSVVPELSMVAGPRSRDTVCRQPDGHWGFCSSCPGSRSANGSGTSPCP